MTITALLDRTSDLVHRSYEQDRKRNPYRYVGTCDAPANEFLFVENVAWKLGCGVDHVRRIPRQELPASKIGQRMLYAREDVINYIRSKRTGGPIADRQVRRLSLQPVAKSHAVRDGHGADLSTFDPVGKVSALLAVTRNEG